MTAPAENVLVGLIALTLLPVIGLRIARGFRDGRLPLYRTYLNRAESGAKFGVLMTIHILSLIAIGVAAADLLLNLGIRNAL